jgi:hypothetical protein
MNEMYNSQSRFVLILAVLVLAAIKVNCQTTIPDVLTKNSLKEQMNYIEERTKIYENYRAIREDMFQKLKVNIADTISEAKKNISALSIEKEILKNSIDSLSGNLKTVQTSLEEITRTKNSIKVLGIEVSKVIYNLIMWTILALLTGCIIIGFLLFKRNLSITNDTKKEYRELKDEFETYRKTAREAREKMSMDHFKEIQKLKGSK